MFLNALEDKISYKLYESIILGLAFRRWVSLRREGSPQNLDDIGTELSPTVYKKPTSPGFVRVAPLVSVHLYNISNDVLRVLFSTKVSVPKLSPFGSVIRPSFVKRYSLNISPTRISNQSRLSKSQSIPRTSILLHQELVKLEKQEAIVDSKSVPMILDELAASTSTNKDQILGNLCSKRIRQRAFLIWQKCKYRARQWADLALTVRNQRILGDYIVGWRRKYDKCLNNTENARCFAIRNTTWKAVLGDSNNQMLSDQQIQDLHGKAEYFHKWRLLLVSNSQKRLDKKLIMLKSSVDMFRTLTIYTKFTKWVDVGKYYANCMRRAATIVRRRLLIMAVGGWKKTYRVFLIITKKGVLFDRLRKYSITWTKWQFRLGRLRIEKTEQSTKRLVKTMII